MKLTYKLIIFLLIVSSLIILFFFFIKLDNSKKKQIDISASIEDNVSFYSNTIKDVEYVSSDINGNEYIIRASKGEIDFDNKNFIYLKKIKAKIKTNDSNEVLIVSSFGKYNIQNNDTIFNQDILIKYKNKEITGEYLDFSPGRNSLILSGNVTFNDTKDILKADVVEINIKTKDIKISMYDNKKKVKIKNIN